MLLFGATLFLSALLLFLVQPMAGKLLLPGFGGTPAVWTACLLFFQSLLVLGYLYAHHCATRLRPRMQAAVHLVLLGATLLVPFPAPQTWWPAEGAGPTASIFGLLARGVGWKYVVLASTSPLLQKWASAVRPGKTPYRLYALSNLGSLLALVSYPFLVEPNLGLAVQTRLWTWGYAGFVALSAAVALGMLRQPAAPAEAAPDGAPEARSTLGERVFWGLLAASGSVALIATTHQICQDVAVVPLLWVLPLAVYLTTFIVCFRWERLYARIPFGVALAAAVVQSTVVLYRGVDVPILAQVGSYTFTLLVACMVCHGELVRRKPAPRELTAYYLAIAVGGAVGGAFCSLAAPLVFKGYWEFHVALVLTCLLALAANFRDPASRLYNGRPFWAWAGLYCGFVALAVALSVQAVEALEYTLAVARNFYGVLRVIEYEAWSPTRSRHTLMNGRIEHGHQYQDSERRLWPTTYYGGSSGVGIAIRCHPRRAAHEGPLRVGVVGLGAGTLATYGQAGDFIRFYEINPEVVRLSTSHFTYTSSSPAEIEVVGGDARVAMERDRRQGRSLQFDVLAVDAFSGDAIPVHLLTRESFEAYWYHLKPDGILALHISSRYLDLRPVVRALAAEHAAAGLRALWIESSSNESEGTDSSDWVLVTRNERFLEAKDVQSAIKPWPVPMKAPVLWTDDYSNLFKILNR